MPVDYQLITWPDSFHKMLYTVEGKAVIDQLWQETMEELKFAGVKEIFQTERSD